MKSLLIFDFDHTIINDNSDTWIAQCTPEKNLPKELKDSYEKGKWNEFMCRVFKYIGDKGIREYEIKRTMTEIPFTEGMIELINFVGRNKDIFDCIIISDSNTVFIDWILGAAKVDDVFDEVFTNPAAFDDSGYLMLKSVHVHLCEMCPKNLCKKKILIEFIEKQLQKGVKYTRIIYLGDGENDFCPLTFLKKNDVAMPRKKYPLHKLISELPQDAMLECSVVVWSSALEIISHLKLLIEG
ncbi:pyridoxal phosphate phosphatase PHOSPHO2 [Macrotis lagotis]|uniref:pyridoxal phosphate phosphatase PHOSPHO2 n=1 Tax=Macrotis lagotis TaxID=92651 RepID=UPI003D69CB65